MIFSVRVDASTVIGHGHVMRCLALADALRANGAICHFISRQHPGNLIDQIRSRGYLVFALDRLEAQAEQMGQEGYSNWLGATPNQEILGSLTHLEKIRPDWVIVDHYSLDIRWESEIRSLIGSKIMVIDDLAEKSHDANLLLNPNLGCLESDYINLVPSNCQILAGPRYALIRPEFATLRHASLQRRRTSSRSVQILVSMGGTDGGNATAAVLAALNTYSFPRDAFITVVMGPGAPWLTQVSAQAKTMRWPTKVLTEVENMAEVMLHSDLAIGGIGGTAWERCCLGLPTIGLILAPNQAPGARALEAAGGIELLKSVDCISSALLEALQRVFENEDRLSILSSMASRVLDGQGIGRVLTLLGDIGG